ncbi:uncharacterized protein LOC131073270 [Cryptomeria japonica]|uniref:uncharacterized protein LOC131073270 n=1 Tax=Cryptomeria japonica TaxID=3369 RepID=UPI0025AB6C27|nr:uncharacterized protein LOC131073270 [Cryptomeria japonica]
MCSSKNISESGWTKYLDKSSTYKSTTHFSTVSTSFKKASGNAGNREEESSMTSDASSGPQQLPLPDNEQEHQASASYPTRIRCLHGRQRDLDHVSSCSFTDGNPRKCKLRRIEYREEAEICSSLQDTASSSVQSSESRLVKGEVNGGESLVDVEPCFRVNGAVQKKKKTASNTL